jgi:hypothetical protein
VEPSSALDRQHARDAILDRLRARPFDAEAFAELARWLHREGDSTRAAAAAREAARLAPAEVAHQRLAGYLLAASGAAGEAEMAFRAAADLDPLSRPAMGDFYLARAWAEYQHALQLGPPDPAVEERLRGLAAVTELSPEVKALAGDAARMDAIPVAEVVPPVSLGAEVWHALVVEKRTQTMRLYARRDDGLVLARTYPVTTGETLGAKERRGDRRTPDGVYVATDLLPADALPDLYGTLAIPLSYPNAWDRSLGRSGSGIWLHGSDRLGAPFASRESRGCVILRNDDLLELAELIVPGLTPVVIAEHVAYRPRAEWQAVVEGLRQRVAGGAWLSVAAASDHWVMARRDGPEVVREFVRTDTWEVIASERTTPAPLGDWHNTLAGLVPGIPGAVVAVRIAEDTEPPAVTIETSHAVRVQNLHVETPRRIYLDLAGVRARAEPTVVEGRGDWIDRVRVATNGGRPAARVVIDLKRPAVHEVVTEGTRTVISLRAR